MLPTSASTSIIPDLVRHGAIAAAGLPQLSCLAAGRVGKGAVRPGRHIRERAPIFPGGDAHKLYSSIRKRMALPDTTWLFTFHDYKAPGRDVAAWETTVKEERQKNVHVRDGVSEDAFVKMREARDVTLSAPQLLLPSIQVNIRAGKIPAGPCQRRELSHHSGEVQECRGGAELRERQPWHCRSTTRAKGRRKLFGLF